MFVEQMEYIFMLEGMDVFDATLYRPETGMIRLPSANRVPGVAPPTPHHAIMRTCRRNAASIVENLLTDGVALRNL